jgi:hypothetical protein
LAGNFAGRGESVEVQATKEGVWVLEGQAQQFLAARATAVTELTPALFIPRPQRYEWSQGQARVKMLHRSEGVCLLAGLSGALRGYGEKLRVSLADDGYWYLEGTSGQGDLSGVAVGLKWAKPGTFTCSATTKTWSTGQEPVSMGKPGEGLCVLSGISGCMLGGGEGVEVIVDNDTWILRGNSQQEELQFEATFIQVEPVAK